MTGNLAVWLHGMEVAVIEQRRGRLRLAYAQEAIAGNPLGRPLLSLSLPLRSEPYTHGAVRPFLDGLLPEGEARRAIAREFRLPRKTPSA